jgi:septal ring factor EnvC (AmiA/AmiB activator)
LSGGLVAAAVLAVLSSGLGAAPRTSDALRQKREALGDLRRQLDQARARAEAARARERALQAELGRVDRDLGQKRQALSALDQRIGRIETELGRVTGRWGRVAEDTVAQHAALTAQLRTLGRLVAVPAPPDWLRGDGEVTRAGQVDDLQRLVRQGAARLTALGETSERLEREARSAHQGRLSLVDRRRNVDQERATMTAEASERRRSLASARDDRSEAERRASDLEESARRLEALVRELGRRSPARVAVARPPSIPPPPAGTPAPGLVPGGTSLGPAVGLGRERGQLPWPTDGRIVSAFGREVHPRFGTEIVRRGIEIEAPNGAPVRAVSGGAVLYRGWLKGYGNLLILDHGQGYYTLYAHAAEVLPDEGDAVRAGQTIARVGESGSTEGPRLYFEVRYQGRAEDPQQWLRRRP